jgi:hypothetical protein
MADDRFFFSEDAEYFDTVDMMERHIGRWLFSGKKTNQMAKLTTSKLKVS